MEKLSLTFRILDQPVSFESGPLPPRMRLDQALGPLRSLDDQAIGVAQRKNQLPVTCSKGCSACCRIQPVPVTPAEAYALLLLVESLPEPRQSEVRARFADRVSRLDHAALGDSSLDPADTQRARAEMTAYLALGLSCPFLDDDCCSIYESRPFACREYLVTSPKELCADPLSGAIRRVPLVLVPAAAELNTSAQLLGQPQRRIPLILALTYAQSHRHELERTYPSTQLLGQILRTVFMDAVRFGSLKADMA